MLFQTFSSQQTELRSDHGKSGVECEKVPDEKRQYPHRGVNYLTTNLTKLESLRRREMTSPGAGGLFRWERV